MRRHPGNTDPTQTPAYLPDWPRSWPATGAAARRVADDTRRHAAATRAARITCYTALTATVVCALGTNPTVAAPVALGIATGIVGIRLRAQRRRRH